MLASDFHDPSTGELVATLEGHLAFVPAALPPQLLYDADLVLLLSRADAALSELAGLGRYLPNPHLLIVLYTWREAVLSSRIEGTRASLSDVLRDEVEDTTNRQEDADVREVRNYVDALEYGIQRLAVLPLSLRLVREMHAVLMSGVRGEGKRPGEFRREQNWIGAAGSSPATADYVPPPPDRMMQALDQWERFINQRDVLPDLIQCALMHEQFEAIHPFLDGNGRLGRLLITLFLLERKRLPQPLLYLSAYIEKHRQDYYDLLQRVRTDGAWIPWLRFFLTGVTETAQAGVRQASQLMELREIYRKQLHHKPKAQQLIDDLFVNPYVTVKRAAAFLPSSLPTAREAILTLQEQNIVQEVTGKAWGRVYLATPILQIISANDDAGF